MGDENSMSLLTKIVTDPKWAESEIVRLRAAAEVADSPQARVLADVVTERQRQDAKWGEQDHTPIEWVAIETEELGEVAQEALRGHFGGRPLEKYREEMIQVAAVAVAAVENFDRKMALLDLSDSNLLEPKNESDDDKATRAFLNQVARGVSVFDEDRFPQTKPLR